MTTEYQFDEDRTATLNQLMSAYNKQSFWWKPDKWITGKPYSAGDKQHNRQDFKSNTKAVVSFVLVRLISIQPAFEKQGKAFDCSSLVCVEASRC